MTLEFILVALIDAQEPMSLKRYDDLVECSKTALELQEFVNNSFNASGYKKKAENMDENLVVQQKKFDELLNVYEKFYTIADRTTFNPQNELKQQAKNSADRHQVQLLEQLQRVQILINVARRESDKAKKAMAAAGNPLLFPARIKYGCLPAPK